MQDFKEWLQQEMYNKSLDGPPLMPHTIYGAESQIRHLAMNIRTTFGLDKRWEEYKDRIKQATDLLDQAADMLDDGSMGEKNLRSSPHRFYRPDDATQGSFSR